jgi:hypothetical protein
MNNEAKTGEQPTTFDLALNMRDRLKGLADLVEIANRHGEAFGEIGDGLVRLLKDAAEDAAELLERLHTEEESSDRRGS